MHTHTHTHEHTHACMHAHIHTYIRMHTHTHPHPHTHTHPPHTHTHPPHTHTHPPTHTHSPPPPTHTHTYSHYHLPPTHTHLLLLSLLLQNGHDISLELPDAVSIPYHDLLRYHTTLGGNFRSLDDNFKYFSLVFADECDRSTRAPSPGRTSHAMYVVFNCSGHIVVNNLWRRGRVGGGGGRRRGKGEGGGRREEEGGRRRGRRDEEGGGGRRREKGEEEEEMKEVGRRGEGGRGPIQSTLQFTVLTL